MPTAPTWTSFASVPGLPPLTPGVLAEILDGGQAFRWHRVPDSDVGGVPSPRAASETWCGQWSDHVVRLRLTAAGALEWSAPSGLALRVGATLPRYLAADRDWPALTDALPWRSDAHLAQCLAAFPGLRILRQPFGETLLSFLCSATKQIVQIKQMLALLAARHGSTIHCRAGSPNPAGSDPPPG